MVCYLGVDRLCKDVEFMIGRNPGVYWRICWGIITPLLMLVILLYTFITYKPITYKGQDYPDTAIGKAAQTIIILRSSINNSESLI